MVSYFWKNGLLTLFILIVGGIAGISVAFAEKRLKTEINNVKKVDLFPMQGLAMLGKAELKPAVEIAKLMAPAPPPPSFIFRGEWHEEVSHPAAHTLVTQKSPQVKNTAHRIVVLEGFNQIFLVCATCSADSDHPVIRPGQALTGGYRFQQLEAENVIVLDPSGQEQSLSTRG